MPQIASQIGIYLLLLKVEILASGQQSIEVFQVFQVFEVFEGLKDIFISTDC